LTAACAASNSERHVYSPRGRRLLLLSALLCEDRACHGRKRKSAKRRE